MLIVDYFSSMKEHIIDFKAGKVHYTTSGKGQTLVFVHGFCEDLRIWEDFAPYFTNDYQVITLDLPGFGQSTTITGCTIAIYADAIKVVLAAENITDSILIGHSLGGYIALELLAQQIPSIKGISLFHSHPNEDSDFKKGIRQKSIDFINKHGSALFVKQMMSGLFEPSFQRSNTFLLEKLTSRAVQYDPSGIVEAQKAMINRSNHKTTLADSRIPIQFIIGLQDQLITEKDSLEQTYLAPQSHVSIHKKAAHMGMFETTSNCQKDIKVFAQHVFSLV